MTILMGSARVNNTVGDKIGNCPWQYNSDVVQNVTQVKIRIKVACKLSVGTTFYDLEQLTYTLQCISYFSETAV